MNCPGYDPTKPRNIPCSFRLASLFGILLGFVVGCYFGWVIVS